MEFLSEELQKYVEEHSEEEHVLLAQINRETYLNVLNPRMLSGHVQGRILSMFSHMVKPKAILEIGTFTGYSALCMAEGLTQDGVLVTIDVNEELETRVRNHFAQSDYDKQIDFRIGNAIDIIPTLDMNFDLVFIDADKIRYLDYYKQVIDKLNTGGFIIADNVLWGGKVASELNSSDKGGKAIQTFNDYVQQDDRVQNVLFPVRDGLMVLRKI